MYILKYRTSDPRRCLIIYKHLKFTDKRSEMAITADTLNFKCI